MNDTATWLGIGIGGTLLLIFLGILAVIVVTIVFRPYVIWYLKINEKLRLQEETNRLLNELKSKETMGTSVSVQRDHSAYMPR